MVVKCLLSACRGLITQAFDKLVLQTGRAMSRTQQQTLEGTRGIQRRDWVGYDIVDHYCKLEEKKPLDVGLNEDGNIEYCLDVGFLCLDDP